MPRRRALYRIRPAVWHRPQTDELVRQRRRRNTQYYSSYGTSRQEFWSLIARRFISSYVQCFIL